MHATCNQTLSRPERYALRLERNIVRNLGRLAGFVVVDMRQLKKMLRRLSTVENGQAAVTGANPAAVQRYGVTRAMMHAHLVYPNRCRPT